MTCLQLQMVPPRMNPPRTSVMIPDDGERGFIDSLIELLQACEGQIQSTEREWITADMRSLKAELLTKAVTYFHDTKYLQLAHYHVDGEAIVVVRLGSECGPRYVGHLLWSAFGSSAIDKIVRYLFNR